MANRTVLLIDYEPRSIEDTRRPLEEAGYVVEIANDGVAGLEAFHRVHPDLVLVEAMLPKKHGFDVCQEIKNSADGKDTPVVITTGVYRGRKYRNQALQNFGCDEYLEKPFTDDALLDACSRFIAREVAERATTPEPSAVESQVEAQGAAVGDGPAALDLERMTEDEISNRLDSLLADFGEAVDAAASPPGEPSEEAPVEAPEPETTPVADGRESIFDTASRPSAPDGSTDRPPEAAATPASPDGAMDIDVDLGATDADPAAVPAGPASAVFAASTDGRDDPASAENPGEPLADATAALPSLDDPGLIPTLPVADRGPTQDGPDAVEVDHDVRARAEVARAPTKSTVLENRPADPARRRWLIPVVTVVVLGAIVTAGALWLRGRVSEDVAPPPTSAVASRGPVTFTPSAAARAGFADDGPAPTDDGPVAPEGDPAEALAAGQDPSVPVQDPAAASTVTEPTIEPAVKSPEPEPAAERVAAARPEPTPAVTKTVEAAEREPVEVPVATRPDPAPVKVAAPVAAAEPPPAVEAAEPATTTASTGTRPTGSDPDPAGTAAEGAGVAAEADPVPTVPEPLETEPAKIVEPTPVAEVPDVPEPPPVRAGDLLEISEVDTEPVALSKPAPRYNAVAKQAKQQGDVVLNVLVDENGAVADVHVLKGIEGSMLDDAAVRAIRKWTYEPAMKDGVPVKVWTMEIISFRL